ncbi:MAG: phosphate transport system substrate-binding protein [Sphingomonadales bacterium]|jgi:phosphate transport system substrate-binding protein|nr:phosphate transport system substrate-binding protein [Sphingomonadales bacterium]
MRLSPAHAFRGAMAMAAMLAPGAAAGLPAYAPQTHVAGEIRNYGFGLGGALGKWEEAFRTYQPDVTFRDVLPTSDAAFPGLVTRQADLGFDGGEPAITEALSFHETRGYPASFVTIASGAFDVEGKSNGPVVFVAKGNPLTSLTMDQLDGIFGAARNGSLDGFVWTPVGARGADRDIRSWGQLGLKGEWANRPIQTYGHGPSGTTRFFQLHVLGNTDKWNPNYRAYVETGSKQIAAVDRTEQRLGARWMLDRELANDPYGISWSTMSQAKGIAGIRMIAIAPRGGGGAVIPSQASFQDRSYPLVRNIYVYFDRKPGTRLDPKLREFLRFILSAEGQLLVSQAGYLPLPSGMAAAERARLD